MKTKENKQYGEFYVLSGEMDDGREFELVFSSAKLLKLLTDNWDKLVNKHINISGKGVS